MANYSCDPYPHLPEGAIVIPPGPLRAQLGYVVVGGELPVIFDDWAIASLVPDVPAKDFHGARALIVEYLQSRG